MGHPLGIQIMFTKIGDAAAESRTRPVLNVSSSLLK
jgi:hypothetical protein